MGARGLAMIGLVVALVACGPEPEPSVTPSPTATPEPTPVEATIEVGVRAWSAGFVIDVIRARTVFDRRGGTVELAVAFENAGLEDAVYDAPFVLTSGGRGWAPDRTTPLPLVPVGGEASTTLRFVVDAPVQPADLILRIGRAEEHQAVVPLVSVPGGPATETLAPCLSDEPSHEPVEVKAGALRLVLRAAEARYDLPDWHLTLGRATRALILTYDATYTGSFSGGIPFSAENVALRLYEGTLIEPRADGRSQSIELLLPGKTMTGLSSRFEIPVGASVVYLVVREGGKEAALEFFVPCREP